jgi:CRP/FNR family cyclic AMP-dependent transcriptional regulator
MMNQVPLFSSLDPTQLAEVERRTTLRRCRKGTVIVERGDEASTLHVLIEGRAKVYVADDSGREIVLKELKAGDHFGELAMLGGSPRTASVMTLTDCELRSLTGSVFQELMATQPGIAMQLIRSLAERVVGLTDMVSDLALLSVYGRIAKLLVESAALEDGRFLTGPLTQQSIADRVGCSREMVSRIVGDLKTGGYLSVEGKRFVLNRRLPERW